MTRKDLSRIGRPRTTVTIDEVRVRGRQAQVQSIVETARELVRVTDDIEAVSMRVLGKSLGLSAAALYRYFPDRESLLKAICVSTLRDLRKALERAGEQQDPAHAVEEIGFAYASFVRSHREEMKLVRRFRDDASSTDLASSSGLDTDPLASSLSTAVDRCVSAGLLDGPVDRQLVAASLNMALSGLTTTRFLCHRNEGHSVDELWTYTVSRLLG
jgi:AcrR family transcriptional regulator